MLGCQICGRLIGEVPRSDVYIYQRKLHRGQSWMTLNTGRSALMFSLINVLFISNLIELKPDPSFIVHALSQRLPIHK